MSYEKTRKRWADRRKLICKMHANGANVKEIATKYGISRQRVHAIFNTTDMKKKPAAKRKK